MEDDRPRDNRGATPAGGRRALTAQNTSDDVAYRHPRMSLFRRPSSTARPGHDDEFNYKGLETLQSRESSAGSSRQPRHVINMEMQQTDQMPSLVPEQRRTLLFMKDEDSFDPTGFPGSTRASPFLKNVGRKSSIPSQLYLTPLVAMENGTCLIHKAAHDGILTELHDILRKSGTLKLIDLLDSNSYAPLHCAVRGNHTECVQLLLEYGADPNVQGDEERTPIFLAAKCNHPAIVEVLAGHPGIETDLPDMYGMLPAHVAARRGHLQVLEHLSKSGALHVDATDLHGNTPLHHCCLSGNEDVAKFLLENGSHPMAKNSNKEAGYHLAAQEGYTGVLKLLVKGGYSGCKPETVKTRQMMSDRDNEGNTVLHLAAQNGHVEVIDLCIENMADIDGKNTFGATPLHLAAVNGHEDAVTKLVESNAKLNDKDAEGMTPLHRATKFNRLSIVQYLLSQEERICVNAQDVSGKSPLLLAAFNGHVDIMVALFNNKGNIHARDARDMTCLHLAVINREMRSVEESIQLSDGLILNAVDRDESTALHLAARKGFFKICQLLSDNRCDMTPRDEHERIPLHWAASEGKFRTTKFLVEATPTDINATDDQCRTPLHLAAITGHQRVCELLMDLGADVAARDNRRWTPLSHASYQGHCNTMESLLERGSPVNIMDHKGNTPLHLACEAGHGKAVKTLLGHDAILTTRNSSGLTCFDVAIDAMHEHVAEVIVRDTRWHEVMNYKPTEYPPMVRLIEKMPNVAELVLDQCIWVLPGKRPADDCVTYDFRYIYEKPLAVADQPENYKPTHPVDLMVKEKAESLLSHRLTQALMKYKWSNFGKWVFLTNLMVYILFISFLTIYVSNNKTKHEQEEILMYNTVFEVGRDAKYVGYQETVCNLTDGRTAHFTYLTGNASIVNRRQPCRALKYRKECESEAEEEIELFSRKYNDSCPSTTYGIDKFNFIIGCSGVLFGLGINDVKVFEWRGYVLGICNNFLYNVTCKMKNGQMGVIYGATDSILLTECASPHTVPRPPPSVYASQLILIAFALLHIFKECLIVAFKGRAYLNDILDSLMEWSLYILTLCFVWPGCLGQQPSDWQWQCGALAVFLAWFNLVLFIQRFSFLGIYVVMFKSVLQTLLEVLVVFLMFVVAFGLCFYILFQGQSNFRTIPWSLLQTFVMMLGEVEYLNIFVSNISDVPYVGISVVIYVGFILIMPILLMNLLVGLAVGDIEAVKKDAFLRRLEMQVDMISSVERWMPISVQIYFHRESLKRYPRRQKAFYSKIKETLNKLTSMGGAEESFGTTRNTENEQRLYQISSELGRQKTRMRGVQKQLDSQSRLLRTIAEQMKIKSEVYESDDDDDVQLDELYS